MTLYLLQLHRPCQGIENLLSHQQLLLLLLLLTLIKFAANITQKEAVNFYKLNPNTDERKQATLSS